MAKDNKPPAPPDFQRGYQPIERNPATRPPTNPPNQGSAGKKPSQRCAKSKASEFSLEKRHRAYPQTLHKAAEAGIANIEAGRFQDFDTSESLRRHLSALAETCLTQRISAANDN